MDCLARLDLPENGISGQSSVMDHNMLVFRFFEYMLSLVFYGHLNLNERDSLTRYWISYGSPNVNLCVCSSNAFSDFYFVSPESLQCSHKRVSQAAYTYIYGFPIAVGNFMKKSARNCQPTRLPETL